MPGNQLIIDADGHILEPVDMWDKYLEEKYRARGIKIKRDDNGMEFLEYDGKPAQLMRSGVLHTLGAMGRSAQEMKPSAERTYVNSAPFGSMDMKERLKLLDQDGIDKAILYPTIGLLWEAEVEDPELSNAYCRAYNRWIADFCRDSGGRLIPIAHLSMLDVPAAVAELERAVKDGCKGAFVAPFNHLRKAHGHPDFDPLFAKFQELDVPYGIHPTFEPASLASRRFSGLGSSIWYHQVTACYGAQVAFTTLFSFGVFDKFPKLKMVVLESGGGMDRLLGGQDGRAVRGPDKSRAAEKSAESLHPHAELDFRRSGRARAGRANQICRRPILLGERFSASGSRARVHERAEGAAGRDAGGLGGKTRG